MSGITTIQFFTGHLGHLKTYSVNHSDLFKGCHNLKDNIVFSLILVVSTNSFRKFAHQILFWHQVSLMWKFLLYQSLQNKTRRQHPASNSCSCVSLVSDFPLKRREGKNEDYTLIQRPPSMLGNKGGACFSVRKNPAIMPVLLYSKDMESFVT